MNLKKINWFGLAGGIATLTLVALALIYASPWWQLSIGEDLGYAGISPLSFSSTILGSSMGIPLIFFINLSCQLSFIASAIAIIVYSVLPEKNYSKHLLGFAYKKPLITVIIFSVFIIGVSYAVQAMLKINIPINGTSTTTLNLGAIEIIAPITAGFTWVFWLALIAAALCVAAKIYHKKIVQQPSKTRK
ncbi:MAG: hypothetical protein QXG76_01230 [Candidatus Bathyarchaeia archaeon]